MVASPQTIAGLPVNVLAVNVIGSFILGLFSVFAVALNLNSNYTLLVATGFCGAFTTMSVFAWKPATSWTAIALYLWH